MTASSATGPPGAQIRAARLRRNLTVRTLASAVGVSPATISQIENGRTKESVSRLGRIADALDMTVAEILDIDPRGETAHRGRAAKPSGAAAATPHVPPIPHWRDYEPLDFDPVLAAALSEFVEIGYHGATVRSIAARCGFSVSGIYHYYTSKQQMLVTILERTMTELLARAEAARGEGNDPVERFSFLIEHLALFHTHRRELGFVGASEMRSLAGSARRRIAAMRVAQQRMVDAEAEQAARQGDFCTSHPREAARAVVTMCTALSGWWRPDGPLAPEQIAEQYVDFALDLMRHRKTRQR